LADKKAVDRKLKDFLERKVKEYNQPAFIERDPVCIPHRFSKKQDIEIAGFFASVFAWGNRTTIISKSDLLMKGMDNAPYEFITGHNEKELSRFLSFRHRTFNATDLLYFIQFLKYHYQKAETLETAFSSHMGAGNSSVEKALSGFHQYFFSLEDAPSRTRKHIASPERGSTCKRLNMFLRWMVRKDQAGVDFGIWRHIRPSQLICPMDVHVSRVASRLGLVNRKAVDWKTALELTGSLKLFDPEDPVKYDYALFGLGIEERF
jgi:uncharacterized protein (TIGR02757 family)